MTLAPRSSASRAAGLPVRGPRESTLPNLERNERILGARGGTLLQRGRAGWARWATETSTPSGGSQRVTMVGLSGWSVTHLEELLAAGQGLDIVGHWQDASERGGTRARGPVFEARYVHVPVMVSVDGAAAVLAALGIPPTASEAALRHLPAVSVLDQLQFQHMSSGALHRVDPEVIAAARCTLLTRFRGSPGVYAAAVDMGLPLHAAEQFVNVAGPARALVCRANPYLAIQAAGLRFEDVDGALMAEGRVARDDPRRLAAAVAAAAGRLGRAGHVAHPEDRLRQSLAAVLDAAGGQRAEATLLASAFAAAEESGAMVVLHSGQNVPPVWYEAADLADEHVIASAVSARMAETPSWASRVPATPADLSAPLAATLAHLSPEQLEGVVAMCRTRIGCLTGRPGTGKTTTMKGLADLAGALGIPVTFAASTGRAARRLAQQTERPAGTIHSLLMQRQVQGPDAPPVLPGGIVVIDEASMLDAPLMARIMAEAGGETALVLVGDPRQLRPVGKGQPFIDFLTAKTDAGQPLVPAAHLTRPYRQQALSLTTVNAWRTEEGRGPLLVERDATTGIVSRPDSPADRTDIARVLGLAEADIPWADFRHDSFRVPLPVLESPQAAKRADIVVAAYKKLLAQGIPPEEILVMTPVHEGDLGTKALNARLQDVLNPEGVRTGMRDMHGAELRVGDRVFQKVPDAQRQLINGSEGVVTAAEFSPGSAPAGGRARQVTVTFESGQSHPMQAHEAAQLVQAAVATPFASQGMEAEVALLVLAGEHDFALRHDVLFTEQTRGRRMTIYCETPGAAARAAGQQVKAERRTGLVAGLERQARPAGPRQRAGSVEAPVMGRLVSKIGHARGWGKLLRGAPLPLEQTADATPPSTNTPGAATPGSSAPAIGAVVVEDPYQNPPVLPRARRRF